MRLTLLAASLATAWGQQVHTAIAVMRASAGYAYPVEGTVRFEQTCIETPSNENPCLSPVKVTVDIKNLGTGTHGFHVHQYGDTRNTSDLSTMSAHFVPYCLPPDIDNDTMVVHDPCRNDTIHGLPPDPVRQPGDMGNLVVGPDQRIQTEFTLGQQKLSLSDRLKSIIGRTVVVHANRDTGEPPYGDAGPPVAYGIIGIARPDVTLTGGTGDNTAQAPRIPTVDQVICTFEKAPVDKPAARISGFALLSLQQPDRPNIVRMQAVLDGFAVESGHSFHFHEWGDMAVEYTQLGQIYRSEGIEVHELKVNSKGQGVFDEEYESTSLLQHVGRSLTIHEGPDRSTPTIAAAACGLAYPGARLDTGSEADSGSSLSSGAVAVITISSISVVVVAALFLLYCFRLPVPFCGTCVYGGNGSPEFVEVPPPPPPKATSTVPPPSDVPYETNKV